eukprot:scaffold71687_cov36-Phaeocystis_antarctica.AAC.4
MRAVSSNELRSKCVPAQQYVRTRAAGSASETRRQCGGRSARCAPEAAGLHCGAEAAAALPWSPGARLEPYGLRTAARFCRCQDGAFD